MILVLETVDVDRPIAFGVVVLFYGDKDYAFIDTDAQAMRSVIAEAVIKEMLPNTEAEVFISKGQS